jgi:hypothetical protein
MASWRAADVTVNTSILEGINNAHQAAVLWLRRRRAFLHRDQRGVLQRFAMNHKMG